MPPSTSPSLQTRMRLRAGARLALLLGGCALGILASACGADDGSEEIMLGEATETTSIERNAARISALERKLERREKRAQAATRAGGSARSGSVLASGADESFNALAGSLGGETGVVLGPVGTDSVTVLGPLQSGSAWSTIKVPIAARVIGDAGGAGALPRATQDQVSRALTASDNAAAAALWAQLSSDHGGATGAATAIGEVLASAGDSETVVSTVGRGEFSPYGQTEWTLTGQERLMSGLAAGCVAPTAWESLRTLMGQVVSDQRWGLGSTSARAFFKGGWGPGADGRYLVRQMGVLERNGGAIAVALAVVPPDGEFSTGTNSMTQLARWIDASVDWGKASPRQCQR
jgi:hypothetical protein